LGLREAWFGVIPQANRVNPANVRLPEAARPIIAKTLRPRETETYKTYQSDLGKKVIELRRMEDIEGK
jgi:hypothetical protein